MHSQRMIDIFIVAKETHNPASPSTFKAVDTGHSLVLVISFRDTPEVIGCRTFTFGPADGLPVQEIVGHHLTLFIARCTVEVDSLLRHQSNKDACQKLPVVVR